MVERLSALTQALNAQLSPLTFGPPTAAVYRPLEYAAAPFARYLERFGAGPKEVMFLGMNPGPFGMTQTGVPFGEVAAVRDWLKIDGPVGRPPNEHPKRPVQGFDCPKSEVSGRRVWAWAAARFGTPERFFARFFIWNYCPLVFLEASGKNRTPDQLPAAEQAPLFAACDQALATVVEVLQPRFVIGFGRFAEARARLALPNFPGTIGQVLHPSPASPAANRGWAEVVDRQLAALGVSL